MLDNSHVAQATITQEELNTSNQIVNTIAHAFSQKVVGQQALRTALLASLMANGHILLESVPGLAKTTAIHTLADSISASFKRIQCTPDLLPSDLIGTQIFSRAKNGFQTQLGPVHSNFVLLDEINRASAKTQSAMLEAMAERQTSIGGETFELPKPFIVLATQNPVEQEGTYELPEAQLDRFLLKEIIDYPTVEEEFEILQRVESGALSSPVEKTAITTEHILYLQNLVNKVYIDDSIQAYIVKLITATRNSKELLGEELGNYVMYGASPRASIAFQQISRAVALMNGRGHVIPEDVKLLRHSILRHRLLLTFEALVDEIKSEKIIDEIFARVPTP